MLRAFNRGAVSLQIRAALVFLALCAAFAAVTVLAPAPGRSDSPVLADGVTAGDAALYRQVGEAVAGGEGYYPAAARLHRANAYPLRPFVTVRPPTLAFFQALAGPVGLLVAALVLVAANALLWYRALGDEPRAVRLGALALVSAFGAGGLSPQVIVMHEWWAGLLLSAALALGQKGDFAARLILAAAAAMVRELAAVFLLLMLADAAWRREWGRAATAALVLGWLVILLLIHKNNVDAVLLPTDAVSGGWFGLRGIAGLAGDIAMLTGLDRLPLPAATFLALAPLAGWILRSARDGGFALAWFASFGLAVMIAARSDNFYWAQLMLPAYLVGWALLLPMVPAALQSAHKALKNAGTKASPMK